MRRAVLLLLAVPGLAFAAPAAPPRSPQARQLVIDLAYAMGETHALRQACLGETDQEWRTHMSRLVEVESADKALGSGGQRRLIESFNAGFSAKSAQFPTCRPEVQRALEEAAAKGEALARRLSGGSAP